MAKIQITRYINVKGEEKIYVNKRRGKRGKKTKCPTNNHGYTSPFMIPISYYTKEGRSVVGYYCRLCECIIILEDSFEQLFVGDYMKKNIEHEKGVGSNV